MEYVSFIRAGIAVSLKWLAMGCTAWVRFLTCTGIGLFAKTLYLTVLAWFPFCLFQKAAPDGTPTVSAHPGKVLVADVSFEARFSVIWIVVSWVSIIQWYLGLWVTWSASVLQYEQKCLINFNLINKRGLVIRVLPIHFVCWASRDHKPLGIVGNRLAWWVSVGIPHSYSQHSC
jgi:hypothetical protein